MKLPPNIPTALILTFLFSLQVPLRLAAPLSHDKLFPNSEPIVPLTLPSQQQIRYERIDNGRIGTRHSNPDSNRDFHPSPLSLPDSFPIPTPESTGSSTVNPPGRLLGRRLLQKGNDDLDSIKSLHTAAAAAAAAAAAVSAVQAQAQWNQLKGRRTKQSQALHQQSNPSPHPTTISISISRKGRRYPRRPLKHLFAHYSYHSNTGGRGVVDQDPDTSTTDFNNNNNFRIKRRTTFTESAADDDDDLTLFNDGPLPSLQMMMTFEEPTITINSTSIERVTAPPPGAGSYLAAMSIGGGGATPRPRAKRSWEASTGSWEKLEARAGNWEGVEKEENKTTGESGERTTELAGRGSKWHGRFHMSLASVAAAAAA